MYNPPLEYFVVIKKLKEAHCIKKSNHKDVCWGGGSEKYITSFIKRCVYVYMYIKYLKDKQNIDCLWRGDLDGKAKVELGRDFSLYIFVHFEHVIHWIN